MSNTLRFTPLYVTQMFLKIKYGVHSCIFIPEVLMESDPDIEKNLHQDLKEIDILANSNDSNEIIKCLKEEYFMREKFNYFAQYEHMINVLIGHRGSSFYSCKDLNDFLQHMSDPTIINHDSLKDLIPVKLDILTGDYCWNSVFDCIFRYILYTKTKHLPFLEKTIVEFKLVNTYKISDRTMTPLFFNY